MGISATHHKDNFSQVNMDRVGQNYELHIHLDGLGERLDLAQAALDAQVWADAQNYMPIDTGNLRMQTNMINVNLRGEVYMYPPELSYGHYQYEGEKYVDPVYGVGAFYSPTYGFWSRPNVTKIPSGMPLIYKNPMAEMHWAEAAYRDHIGEWIDIVKSFVR